MARIVGRKECGTSARLRFALLAGTALVVFAPAIVLAADFDLNGSNQLLPQTGSFGDQSYINGTDNLTNSGSSDATLTEGGGVGATYSGNITDGPTNKTGITHTSGDVQLLSTGNTYSGDTTIQGGTWQAGATGAFSAQSSHVLQGGTLDLNGFDQNIGSLAGSSGTVTNSGGSLAILTLGFDNKSTIFGGSFVDGNGLALVKDGSGTLTLTGSSTISGSLTICSCSSGFTIDGSGSFTAGQTLVEGGTLTVSNGGTLTTSSGGASLIFGANALITGNNGSGTNSSWSVSGGLSIGDGTNASNLTIAEGAIVTDADNSGVTVSAGSTLQFGTGLTGSAAGSLSTSAALLNQGAIVASFDTGTLTLDMQIAGGGTLAKSGTGTLALTAINSSYSGAVSVTGGTLSLTNENAAGSGNITLGAGTTLQLDGSFSTATTGTTLTNSIQLTGNANIGVTGTNIAEISGTISEDASARSLTKTDTGTLILSGNNTYSGGTILSGGTLIAGVATVGTPGAITSSAFGTGTLTFDGGTLQAGGNTIANTGAINTTGGTIDAAGRSSIYSGAIGNGNGTTGTLTVTDSVGGGSLTLSGANTYSGGTILSGGTLIVGVATVGTPGAITSSAIGTGTLTFDGGTLQAGGNTIANAGAINTNGGTIDAAGQSFIYSGAIGNGNGTTGTLNVIDSSGGGSIVTFSGANTYSSATNVGDGTNAVTLQGGAANSFSANSATTINTGATLDLGGFAQAIGSLAGSGTVTNNGGSNAVLTTGGDNTSTTFTGVIQDGSKTTALTKTGGGTLFLAGANTYSGGTILSGGTLIAGVATVGTPGAITSSAFGTGTLTFDGGTLQAGGNTIANTGAINTTGGTIDAAGQSFIYSGAIGNGNGTTGTLNVIDSSGGGSIVTFSGANTYSGATNVGDGTNAVTLQGGAANSFSANSATTINTGATLDLGGFAQAIGSLAGSGTATNNGGSNAVLTAGGDNTSTTFSGFIQDGTANVGLTKTGTGTLILSGNNTYTGGTTVSAGMLSITNNNALGFGAVTLGGGTTLQLDGSFSTSGTGTTLTNNIGLVGNANIDVTALNIAEISGVISEDSSHRSLTKTGTGTLILSGINSYSGGTTLSAGTLGIGNSSALGTGTLTFDGGTLQAATGGLTVGNAVLINTTGGTIDTNGTTLALSGGITDNGSGGALNIINNGSFSSTLTLSGTSTYSGDTNVNGTTLQGGSANAFSANSAVTLTGATIDLNGFNQTIKSLAGDSGSVVTNFGSTAAVLTAGGAADTAFHGVIQDGSSASVGLTKTGTGTLTLDGFNSYSGATNVQGGTLSITTATALPSSTDVTVSTGATLKLGDGFSFNIRTLSDGTGGSGSTPASVVIGTTDSNTLLSITGGTGTNTFSGQITGAGSLSYSGGGTLVLAGVGSSIGSGIGGGGSLNVGSFSSPGTTGGLTITGSLNSAGTTTVLDGTLTVSNGGTLTSGSTAIVSGGTGAAPTVTITGTGSTWNVAGGLSIGDVFGTATSTVTVADGGTLKITTNNLLNIGVDGVLNIGSGVGAGTIDVPGIQNNGQIVANFTDTSTLNASISGNGTLTKDGIGTLIVTGDSSYVGGTTIAQGTIQIGNGGTTGFIAGAIVNNGVLAVNRAANTTVNFDDVISGTGSIQQIGPGITLLNAANTYSGGTTISAGVVVVNNSTPGSSSSVGTGIVTLDGGTFQAGADNLVFSNAFRINATGGTVDTGSNTLTLSGSIGNGSGNGALTKEGGGTLILTTSNSYSGGTTINNGTLQIGDSANTGTIVGAVINNSVLNFVKADNSGITTLANNGGTVNFRNSTNGGSMVVTNTGGNVNFRDGTGGGSMTLTNTGGNVNFSNTANASNMTLNNTAFGQVTFSGTSGAGNATISNVGAGINFNGSSTASTATITNGSVSTGAQVIFSNTSTAGSSTITNGNATSIVAFFGQSTGGNANLINSASGGIVDFSSTIGASSNRAVTAGSLGGGGAFYLGGNELTLIGNGATPVTGVISDCGSGTSCITPGTGGSLVVSGIATLIASNTYTGGTTVNGGNLTIGDSTHTGAILGALRNSGTVEFVNANLSGMTTITNSGALNFHNTTSAGNVTITNNSGGTYNFYDSSTAGNANITLNGGIPAFHDNSTAGNATITINGGIPQWLDNSTAGNANITINSGIPQWTGNSTAGNATITVNNGIPQWTGNSTAGSANITINGGIPQWLNNSTAGNATIVINGGIVQFLGNSTGGAAAFTNSSILDFSGTTGPNNDNRVSAGSIAGTGSLSIGANELTVGGNNLSTTYGGGIDGTGGSLVKVGSGTLTLSGADSYTGATTVSAGTLFVTGSIAGTGVTIASGASLGGTGSVSSITVASGGILAPGLTSAPGTLHVQGSVTLSSGSTYLVQAGPQQTFSLTTATGAAALTGSNAGVTFASGLYKAGTYAILTANGGLGGTQFASFNTLGLANASGFRNPHLTYDANDVFLVLDQSGFNPFAGNGNVNSVGNAITSYVNNGGTLPAGFLNLFNLSGGNLVNALNSLSGEAATGGQQVALQSTNAFFGALFGQIVGSGGFGGGTGGATGFAAEQPVLPDEVALAYASVLKAPALQPASFTQRWSVWGSAYGGYNKTTGDTVTAGTHDLTARAYGFAAGANYSLNATTTLGFALAGGGTNWGVADGLGSGRGDSLQAAVYGIRRFDQSYVAAALTFGNHWMSTDRFATGGDHLTSSFTAQSYGARLEGGHRYTVAEMGVTPYAAIQTQLFRTPSYSESDLTGGGFGLSFAAHTATATRGELGARFDKSMTAKPGMQWILSGKLAWAHDWNSDPTASATFQALPGASFVVSGVSPAKDSALVSLGSEVRMKNGISLLAKFDGEFASRSTTYTGTGTVRYAW